MNFRWLHFSDLHAGMGAQRTLWPNLKHALLDDLRRLYDDGGSWQAVIFSGDLTQRGTRQEFDLLDTILTDLWGKFSEWGFVPKLVAIPGNHDISRPKSEDPEVLLLDQWFTQASVQENFFANPHTRYRKKVERALAEYDGWTKRAASLGFPLADFRRGHLPGDMAVVLESDAGCVGITCLNSTWLHLSDRSLEGSLHVDIEQLLAVTENDPGAWVRKNDLNILVTHHPDFWLHPDSRRNWDTEISPPGRYDVHLFGHMHDPTARSVSVSGSATRHTFQAPSLFGLEKIANGVERTHGYFLAGIKSRGQERQLCFWPRRLTQSQGGTRRLVADSSFELDPDDSFSVILPRKTPLQRPARNEDKAMRQTAFTALSTIQEPQERLRKSRYHLTRAMAHLNVRRVEQDQCLEGVLNRRCLWLISEWGLAADEFLWSVLYRRQQAERPVYRIDLSDFVDRAQFTAAIAPEIGCSFEEFCDHLSNIGSATLLLDEVPTHATVGAGAKSIEEEAEELAQVVLEYCPEAVIVLRTRRPPASTNLSIVTLKAMDEADLKSYVAVHERGRADLLKLEAIELIFRHTDGVPARVDSCLRDLEVVTLQELVSSGMDRSKLKEKTNNVPLSLQRTIQELSADDNKRQLRLLHVLAIFPHGEQLSRIRRFDGPHPFFPQQATDLFDRALITTSETYSIEPASEGTTAKVLLVPRPIRDFIGDQMDDEATARLVRQAADLYFGADWMTGSTKWPAKYRYDTPECSHSDTANASAILLRLMRNACLRDDSREIGAIVGLAAAFADALHEGDHFRGAVIFCEDFLPLLPDDTNEEKHNLMLQTYGRSLRMVGRIEESESVLTKIIDYPFSKWIRQIVWLNLALCYEKQDRVDKALKAAERVIKIDRHSNAALHAQSIILDHKKDDPKRAQKLEELERVCRKRKAYIVANNIALLRAGEVKDNAAARVILEPVVQTAKQTNDFYNAVRASIELAQTALSEGKSLTDEEHSQLIGCYQFLFNERLAGLFNRCHEALWNSFSSRAEVGNLLTLFRYSSLIWRLRGEDSRETRYADKLTEVAGANLSIGTGSDRATAYYLARLASRQALGAS